jgi:hypothetical protein
LTDGPADLNIRKRDLETEPEPQREAFIGNFGSSIETIHGD